MTIFVPCHTNSFSKWHKIASGFLRIKLSKMRRSTPKVTNGILGGGIILPPVTVLNQKDAARVSFLK